MDLVSAILILGGAIFSLAAGVGLIRFPDVLTRLHAVTKPQVLGLIMTLIAIAVTAKSWLVLLFVFPVFIFQALTAPVSAHMVARSAYRLKEDEEDNLFKDELADPVNKAASDE